MISIKRTDIEIHWKSGQVSRQLTPFGNVTGDWNNDGDVYELFGACFEGKYSGKAFYTPDDIENLVESGEATIV